MSKVPRVLKLMQAKARQQDKLNSLPSKPYGGGNPYYYCSDCERSMVEVSYKGHSSGCVVAKLEQSVKALDGQIKQELEIFVKNKVHESSGFKNYLWFKKDVYVPELSKLLDLISKF